ncbi:MAG: hypothetical protein ACOY3P_11245 [Planctomycetota bacterium]
MVLLPRPLLGDESSLPKTGPTERILVLDVAKDKGGAESDAALMAIACLQGLVNRQTSEKIYLKSFPIRIYDSPEKEAGPGDFYQHALDDGLIPYPAETPAVDTSKRYPVLSYLTKRFARLLQGKVRYSSFRDGSKVAALNACTFDSLLPLTPELDRYLSAEGIALEQKADVRGMGYEAAFDWSMERYIDRAERNRQVIAFPSQGTPAMCDYWVATHTFAYYLPRMKVSQLGGKKKTEVAVPESIDERYARLLDPKHYPLGVPNIGEVEGVGGIPRMQQLGYTCVCGEVPNASATSSIPLSAAEFQPAPKPKAQAIDADAVYISFHANDGDAIDWVYLAYKNLRNDPASGNVPMAWKINPYFIDLFPTLTAWFSRQHPEQIDLMFSMNDGGGPPAGPGREHWEKAYRSHFVRSEGAVQTALYFGPVKPAWPVTFFGDAGALYVVRGYQGRPDDNATQWLLVDGTVTSDSTGMAGEGPEGLYRRIKDAIARSTSGQPQFIMGRLGIWNKPGAPEPYNTRRGIFPASAAKVTIDLLESDPAIGRRLVFLPPRDLAATYRQWRMRSEDK